MNSLEIKVGHQTRRYVHFGRYQVRHRALPFRAATTHLMAYSRRSHMSGWAGRSMAPWLRRVRV